MEKAFMPINAIYPKDLSILVHEKLHKNVTAKDPL
jgi:hypothetical protein